MKFYLTLVLFGLFVNSTIWAADSDSHNDEKVVLTKDFIEKIHNYDVVYTYKNGLAKVVKDGKCGFINTLGDLVIPCVYEKNIGYFSEGLAIFVNKDGKFCIVNKRGKIRVTEFTPCWTAYSNREECKINGESWWDEFQDGVVNLWIDNGELFGQEISIDKMGQIIEDTRSNHIEAAESTQKLTKFEKEFTDKKGHKEYHYGLKDKSGKIVVEPIFWHIGEFNNGVANAIIYIGEPSDFWGYYPINGIYLYGYIDEYGNMTFTREDFDKIERYKREYGY